MTKLGLLVSSCNLPQRQSRHPPQLSSRYPPQLSSRYPPQLSSRYPPQLSSRYPPQLSSRYPPQLSICHSPQLSSCHLPQMSSRRQPQLQSRQKLQPLHLGSNSWEAGWRRQVSGTGCSTARTKRSCDAVCVWSQSMMAHGQHAAHRISGTVQTAFVCVYVNSYMIYNVFMCCWQIQNVLLCLHKLCCRKDWLLVNRE